MANLARGRDREATVMMEERLRVREACTPVLVAFLALTYLLNGDAIGVGKGDCVRVAAQSRALSDGR
jgi:hypothetical protein